MIHSVANWQGGLSLGATHWYKWPSHSLCCFATGTEFEVAWRGLRSHLAEQAAYVKILDPDSLETVFKQSMTGPLLASIATAALHDLVGILSEPGSSEKGTCNAAMFCPFSSGPMPTEKYTGQWRLDL